MIAQLSYFNLSNKNRIVVTFLLLLSFIMKIIFGFVLNENAFRALQHRFLFSEYDATNYYLQSVYDVATQNTFIPELHWSVADPGFNIMLYWVGKIYSFCFQGLNISYFHFIYLLIFVHTLTFLYIIVQLEKSEYIYRIVLIMFSIFVLFEPMMLRFSFSLEREIVVSLIFLIFIVAYMDNNVIAMLICSILLVWFRDVYLFLLPVFILSYLVFRKFFKGHLFLFLLCILILFALTIHCLSTNNEEMASLFFQHGKLSDETGFGTIIMSSGYFIRIILYSLLGFVAPVPIYPFFDRDLPVFYMFSFIMGLSSISYLFLNSYIIYFLYQFDGQIKKQKSIVYSYDYLSIYKVYISLFILHLTFHGLIYNIRHRLQILPGLIYLFLYILNFQYSNKSFSIKINIEKCFYLCLLTIFLLNILYIVLKKMV